MSELNVAGNIMSNILFNLAQQEGHVLTRAECDSMDRTRRQWDAVPARAAPDEASRTPAPISDERSLQDKLDTFEYATLAHSRIGTDESRSRLTLARDTLRALLTQSQGGQPATSREQGDDARQVEYEVHGLLADGESIMQYASSTDLAEALNYARGYDADGEIVQVFEVTRRPIGGDYERWQRLTGITPATEGAKP